MTVGEIRELLGAETEAQGDMQRAVSGCLVCDIMSSTMAKGFRAMAWITHRSDMNALAVAVMTGAACMIFPAGIRPEAGVKERAEAENMPLLCAGVNAFELAGQLYEAGLRGEEIRK